MNEFDTQSPTFINFSYNHNNKLACKCFTTLRKHNKEKFFRGKLCKISLLNRYLYDGTILDVITLKLLELNDWQCYIDAGLCFNDFVILISKMYPDVKNIMEQKFDFILLEKILVVKSDDNNQLKLNL